jgi:hypothetical protein
MSSKPGGGALRKIATDIDTDGGGRAASNQLSELASVAATDIEHRPPGDIAQKVSLRRPLEKPIQRVFPASGPLVVWSEFWPRLAQIPRTVHV